MSEQHTKGQLLTAGDYPNGKTSICTHTGTGWREIAKAKTEADARRLVACWNMLEGETTENIEANPLPAMLDKLESHIESIETNFLKVAAQRDELLAALKDVLAWGTDENYQHARASSEKARAAIAKAEGGSAPAPVQDEPDRKHDNWDVMRDYFQQGKPEGMTDEGWRQLTEVTPFRLRQVMKGHLYSLDVIHESLNRVAAECLDGFGWSTGEWVRKDGMPGSHIEKNHTPSPAQQEGGAA